MPGAPRPPRSRAPGDRIARGGAPRMRSGAHIARPAAPPGSLASSLRFRSGSPAHDLPRPHLGPPPRLPRALRRGRARPSRRPRPRLGQTAARGLRERPHRRSRRALRPRGDGPPACRRGGRGGLFPPARRRVRSRLPRRTRPSRRRTRLHLLRLRRPPLGAAARRGDPGDGPARRSRRRSARNLGRRRRSCAPPPDGAVARRPARGAQPLLHRRGARRAPGLRRPRPLPVRHRRPRLRSTCCASFTACAPRRRTGSTPSPSSRRWRAATTSRSARWSTAT